MSLPGYRAPQLIFDGINDGHTFTIQNPTTGVINKVQGFKFSCSCGNKVFVFYFEDKGAGWFSLKCDKCAIIGQGRVGDYTGPLTIDRDLTVRAVSQE